MKLYFFRLPGFLVVRNNVADPFHANPQPDEGARLRDASIAAGMAEVDRLEDADVAALPAHWTAYPADRRAELERAIAEAAGAGRRVLVWVNGDDEIDLPYGNVVQFQHAVRRSRSRRSTARIYPAFLEDPLHHVFDGAVDPRAKGPKAVVGFCGQARPVPVDEAKRVLHKGRRRVLWRARRSTAVPEPWPSHVLLRKRVLDTLAADPTIDTDFVIRDRYRAGVERKAERRDLHNPSQLEFYDDIRRTDATVSVRGGGNFSVRLVETACLGRRPLVVDSDGLLPWPDHPFWSTLAVVVPDDRLDRLGPELAARHAARDDDQWRQDQLDCRRFWEERLSIDGYFAHLAEALAP